jgi:CRISPR-associated endonuclease/helicase Cas3
MKFVNLTNSVIILDEIQSIPYNLWELIRVAFQTLGNKFNCYFILMSATQPLIFEPEKEIKELVPNHKMYFKYFNRTKLINIENEISFEEFTNIVCDYIFDNPQKDILVILNTKKFCLKCFEKIIDNIPEDKSDIYYLSTLITPFERKQIIDKIKDNNSKKQKIIISTQLIEAGVDISVDTVFRTFAPLDSIIQSAGRSNRYNEKSKISEVYLYRILELKTVTGLIYGPDLILKTKNIFQGISEINENKYLSLIENYFQEVKIQSKNVSSNELKALLNLDFGKLGEFQYIEERKTESIFIQLNKDAKEIWDKYEKIYSNDELSVFDKREQFAKIKSKFYDFVINIPIPYNQQAINFDSEKISNFYLSKLKQSSDFYNYEKNDFRKNTGYNSNNSVFL